MPASPELQADRVFVEEGPGNRSDVSRAAIRGAAWMGFATWINQVAALAAFVVLGRVLSPQDFGVVAAASVILWLLRVVVDQGFGQVLVQWPELTALHVDSAFWTALGTGIVIALATAASAPLIADLYSMPQLTDVLRALSVVFLFVALDSTQSALLARSMEFHVQAVRRMVASVVSGVVAVVLAFSGAGVWALVVQILMYEALLVALLWSRVSWRPGLRFSRVAFKELFGFGIRMSLIKILTNLGAYGDNLLVGIFVGAIALGYYVVGFRVVVVVNTLIALGLSQVVLSTFSRLQHDVTAINSALYRSTGLAAIITLPVYVGLALVAHPLIVCLFGEKWAPSTPVMQALTIAGFVQCQLIFTTQYVVALGRVGNELKWTAGLIGAELIAFGVAVQFGIVAVAWSLGIVLLIAWPIRLWLLHSWGGVKFGSYFRPFPSLLMATLVMTVAVVAANGAMGQVSEATRLLVGVGVGALVYPLAILVFARGEFNEMRVWLSNIRES